MHVHNSLFKAYDVRGIYPEAINEQVVGAIARAYSAYLSEIHERETRSMAVVVGSDARVSSPALVREVVRGSSWKAIAVSHDAAEPLAYRFDTPGGSAAVLTDLG